VKGLRLTKRGEIVRDALIVAAAAAAFFPALTLIILAFNSIGLN
jgi:hypothetical protein